MSSSSIFSQNECKEEESYLRFIDSLNDGFELLKTVTDEQGNIIDFIFLKVNHAYEIQSGLRATNIVGKRKRQAAPAAEQSWYDYAIEATKTSKTLSYEYFNPNVNRLFETQFIPILPNQIAVIFRDITERKKAQEALKESEELYRRLFEKTEDGFQTTEVIYDEQGKPVDLRYLLVNSQFIKQTGIKKTIVEGKTAKELFPGLEASWLETYDKVLKTGKPTHFENYNKDTKRWYDAHLFIYTSNIVGGLFRDITERKKAEKALEKSEEFYRTLFDNSEDGFMLVEPIFSSEEACDFRFLEFNKAYERQTGAKADDIRGKLASQATPALEPQITQLSGKIVKTGKAIHNEAYNKYSDKWYDSYYFPFSKGKVGILFRDITDRKKIENALNESQKKYRNLIETTSDFIWEIDSNGKYTFCSPQIQQLFGVKPEEMIGKTPFDMIPETEKMEGLKIFEKVIASQKPFYGLQTIALDSQGRKVYLETNGVPFFDDNGKLLGYRGISRDITGRKKAEEDLKKSEEKFEKMIEQSPTVFEVYDKTGLQIQVNRAWDRLWGIPRESSVGKWNVLQSKQAEELGWLTYIKRAYAGETVFVPEKEFNASLEPEALGKGCNRWLTSLIYPIKNAQEEVTNIVMMHEDITEKKNLEKKLRDNERMAIIGQTAGMVGHDIRNPLQAIIGELYVARSDIENNPERPDREEVLDSVNFIQQQVDYINKIVSDLQDFARPIVPEYSIADLSDVIVHVFETVSVPESVKLSVNVRDAEKIRVDPTLLQRVTTNLVNNAIQAMPKGGKLEVCGEQIDSKIVVTVSDTGVGIPEEVKSKLFTPMMTTKAKGQGFGLAASKRMIEAMNGTISFESEKGKGTKFKIELPAQ